MRVGDELPFSQLSMEELQETYVEERRNLGELAGRKYQFLTTNLRPKFHEYIRTALEFDASEESSILDERVKSDIFSRMLNAAKKGRFFDAANR